MKHAFAILILSLALGAQTKIDIDGQTKNTLPISRGGTGQTSQQAAIDALVPAQSGQGGKCLSTDGTNTSWATCGSGGGLADPGANGMLARTALDTTTARTITGGTGVTCTNGDGVSGNPTCSADTAVMLTRAQAQAGSDLRCAPSSASGANYTCSLAPVLTAYTNGMVLQFEPDVNSSAGAVTVDVNSVGSVNIKQSDGTTDPGADALVAGRQVPLTYDGTVFRMAPSGVSVTANRAVVSDGSGAPSASTTTATEIGYVNGVTSAIQTQLNGKLATTTPFNKAITVESPTGAEDITLWYTDDAITVTRLSAVCVGSTPSLTWTVRHGSDRSAAGNEVVTGGTTTTSTTTGSQVTSFNDATVAAASWLWLETTATSGTVAECNVTIEFTRD